MSTVGIDATPLLGTRTGIGVYVENLLASLVAQAGAWTPTATGFTLRGGRNLAAAVAIASGGAAQSRVRPVPARLLRASWARLEFPPVEWLCGRVDVFHGTNFVLPPSRAARGVVTVQDLSFFTHPETVSRETAAYRNLVPRSIRRARVVCTPTAAIAAEVVARFGLDTEAVVVTPLGVDPAWFDAEPLTASERAALGLPPIGHPYLVAVGTLEPRKNLARLLAAHTRLWKQGEQLPLVLVGPAGWGPPLELDHRPAGSVLLTGYLSTPRLRNLVASARLLVFPSLYEGFGLPPVEAMAAGTQVVASDLTVTREVLGCHAGYFNPLDVDSIAAAISRSLAADPAPEAVAGAKRHASGYSWGATARATVRAYQLAAA